MEIPVDDGIVLYTYWRSSAAYRVRIGLALKGLAFEARPVHLVREGGEQHHDAYRGLNPQQLVPTLLHDGHVLTQSLAILEYLEERFPQVPLLPVVFGATDAWLSMLTAGTVIILVSMLLAFLSGMDIKRRIVTNLVIIAAAVGVTYAIGRVVKDLFGISI